VRKKFWRRVAVDFYRDSMPRAVAREGRKARASHGARGPIAAGGQQC
jgi:hypothetical protein